MSARPEAEKVHGGDPAVPALTWAVLQALAIVQGMDEVDMAELVRQNMLGLIGVDSRLPRLQRPAGGL